MIEAAQGVDYYEFGLKGADFGFDRGAGFGVGELAEVREFVVREVEEAGEVVDYVLEFGISVLKVNAEDIALTGGEVEEGESEGYAESELVEERGFADARVADDYVNCGFLDESVYDHTSA